jgi:Nickel responsive protein SCO4226-like
MPSYLVEGYAPESAVDDRRERARLTGELGAGVRYVRTTFLPDDEVILHLFEATSPDALRHAARVAALPYERIVEAVEGSRQ